MGYTVEPMKTTTIISTNSALHNNNHHVIIMAGGFSLVEALISVVILGIAVLTGVSIFNLTTSETRRGRGLNEQQSAVAADISALYSVSERYSCGLSGGVLSCSVASVNNLPNQFTYVSSQLANEDEGREIGRVCSPANSPNILTSLITSLGNTVNLAQETGISRDISQAPGNENLIRIRYLRGADPIYTTFINPPITRWCP
jgi:type II secretory pathway pseudopilin PulG